MSTFKVAASYIGTIVGAGFASGQEILQFFGFFGLSGMLAIGLATCFFIFFGMIILELGRRLRASSHLEIIRHAAGRWLGSAVDGIVTFFLFGALAAMIAGAGAIFTEQFGLPRLWGAAGMAAAGVITVLFGIGGVISAISYVVPLLLVSILGISLGTLLAGYPELSMAWAWAQPFKAPVSFWPLSALIYASYNLVLGVAVLAPLGALAGSKNILKKGAFYGGLGLGAGALAILLAILVHYPLAAGYEIPMVYIAGTFSPLVQIGYSIVLTAEVYTTAVGSLYGFAARLAQFGVFRFKWLVVGSRGAAFGAGLLGFSNLVRVLYPLVGIAGLLMLGGLTYGYLKEKLVPAWEPDPEAGSP